ncbi:12868_t:CDS:2 [Cetraspora pellucida]|uniref:12868_t:CDS:1 n=1 Tax=Cetraspora pellucida TaxID=1433469 RepID=A0ACA9K7Z8_9GLOM|nr:12868_t:CDS:2 [Cetraspora pellucida]
MEKLTDVQKGIAEKRPAKSDLDNSLIDPFQIDNVPFNYRHSVEKNSKITIEQSCIIASSVLIGYIISYKSFSSCMADVQLQQLQKHDTERRKEAKEGMSDVISRDQFQESVFTDPYNAENGRSKSKD